MDGRHNPLTTPTFSMELAKLCRLTGSDLQARPITQYPSVDFSYYNSSRFQNDPTTSTPHFIPVPARNGSKRIRVSEQNNGPSRAHPTESLPLGIERSTNALNFNRELLGVALVARVKGSPAVSEPEKEDPPEMSDDDAEEENDHDDSTTTTRSCDDGVDDEPADSDPCDVLGSNVFRLILGLLDCKSLCRCLAVSAAWRRCAQDDFLWAAACQQLWAEKIHIHPTALLPSTPRLKAFQISKADSQRTRIEARDLCTVVWELRYKEHTGEYWKQLDPYYRGLPLMRRIFHTDGHITAEPMDQIWGGHECSWTLRKSKSKGGPPLVRINHWPPLTISRTPAWGWIMENAWVVYTSTGETVTSSPSEIPLNTTPA
ncbi:hypothetical protein Mapa_011675 [Marchantia paleacea]|nr:hypothetical protein Mapa_011675 [Marchantia paleacea]